LNDAKDEDGFNDRPMGELVARQILGPSPLAGEGQPRGGPNAPGNSPPFAFPPGAAYSPSMAKVLILLPAEDFDPTEVAVPWRVLTRRGHDVAFATPDGAPGAADDIMLTGRGLDPWGFLPGLRRLTLIGRALRAGRDARAAYAEMIRDAGFRHPLRWDAAEAAADADAYDGLILPGGHRARGMRRYLESPVVQRLAVAFFRAGKPVGAICHGVLVLARSIDPATGRSVLYGRKTTALTWPLERSAAALGRIARFWDPHYYRTYRDEPGQPAGHMSVQAEVTRALRAPADFLDVPPDAPDHRRKTSGLARDSETDHRASFVARDGAYVSARWPGDAHLFAAEFAALLGDG
jgi:putative intracellular protease/amidase